MCVRFNNLEITPLCALETSGVGVGERHICWKTGGSDICGWLTTPGLLVEDLLAGGSSVKFDKYLYLRSRERASSFDLVYTSFDSSVGARRGVVDAEYFILHLCPEP